jgi:hypothetical protein
MLPRRAGSNIRVWPVAVFFSMFLLFCTSTSSAARPKYIIDVTLNPEGRQAKGTVTLQWDNTTSKSLSEIPLEYYTRSDSLPGITAVRSGNRELAFHDTVAPHVQATYVELGEPWERGEGGTLEADFTVAISNYSWPFMQLHDKWFPMLPGIIDGNFDFMTEQLADMEMTIRSPEGWTLATSGMQTSRELADGIQIITASAADIRTCGILLFDETRSDRRETEDGVVVISHWQEGGEKWGRFLLEKGVEIIEFYEDEIGFYPQPVLTIIPGSNRSVGGYPVVPNVVAIHQALDTMGEEYAAWILSHEIGHQYWGFGYTLLPLDAPKWLGLSMGIYTDRLYSDHAGLNRDLHDDFSKRYQRFMLQGHDLTINQDYEDLSGTGFDWNNAIAHGKSFAVLELLEDYIGPETFRSVHDQMLKRFHNRTMRLEDFQTVAEEMSGRDLEEFFNMWYESNEVLDVQINRVLTWMEDDTHKTLVELERIGGCITSLPLVMTGQEGETKSLTIDIEDLTFGGLDTVVVKTAFAPLSVQLDPDRTRPTLWSHVISNPEILMDVFQDAIFSSDAVLAARWGPNYQRYVPESVLKDYYLARYDLLTGEYGSALRRLEEIISRSDIPEENRHYIGYSHYWTGFIHDTLGQRNAAVNAYRKALEFDQGRERAERALETPNSQRPEGM